MNTAAQAVLFPRLTGVYVHLPYCDVKCAYCDFYSLAARHVDDNFWRGYTRRLIEDLRQQYELLSADTQNPVLASVFFGGGTPSKAPAYVFAEILAAIDAVFAEKLAAIEITAEANPESLTAGVAQSWKSLGINRVSVGMQSLDEATLRYLGRLYRPQAYERVLQLVADAGITNINADFITGVPGQSVTSTLKDLDFAVSAGVTHLSLYQLTVEPGTLLKQRIARGALPNTDDAQQLAQMQAAIAFLAAEGFHRYEISNFSRSGYGCLHNLIYWTNRPYIGLGVAAHMYTGRRRFFHPRSIDKYLASGMAPLHDAAAERRDALINLLRLTKKFHRAAVTRLFTPEQQSSLQAELDRATKAGWLKQQGPLLQLTDAGLSYSDSLIAALWNL